MTDKDPVPKEIAGDLTGLPWPKTWRGLYTFVIGNFVFWLALLTALTGLGS
ncbi:MAG: hypothetical protein IPP97_16250 [Candidatus Obscuribacter sp.]|jgi:hypothetical protein|nr:hypothetical protein [Candidatus Obscuribacter sp.]MBP6350183.1 hypothetical protein [Candidatus Obscuribacter sp.]MBP6593453.1 hypothetical protein [Candidatus Obscuribacter sp.]MBP7578700.1 hypothetical protein [Candidatus Obscuribacter sp.]